MKKILLIFIFFLKFSLLNADINIAYIDVNTVLNTSLVGKSLNNYLNSIKDKNLTKYKKMEEDLRKKESNLISQKNIINQKEFEKNIKKLQTEVSNYNIEKKKSIKELKLMKIENTKKVLNILNPIITKYVEENSISAVFPKKNIIVGRKKLDITESIINLLNNEIKEMKF